MVGGRRWGGPCGVCVFGLTRSWSGAPGYVYSNIHEDAEGMLPGPGTALFRELGTQKWVRLLTCEPGNPENSTGN